MDRLIKRWDAVPDEDLMLCEHRGVAYQRNMARGRVAYDAAYLANYDAYAANPVSEPLNRARCELVLRHAAPGTKVLDVGAAAGVFVRTALAAGLECRGFDVIPQAVERLRADELYADDPGQFDAVTFWDSLEHMEDPGEYVSRVKKGGLLFVAVPLFEDLRKVRASKHYKPGEHLYYWTASGFVDWMALHGFRLLEASAHEIEAGREAIGAYAFRRDLPDRRDHIAAYMEIHSTRHYGDSATELYLDLVARVVKIQKPKSILDYGCGRSDLVAHFWRDGERHIARYDPAIPQYKHMPVRPFDLTLACDVMEHIPMASVDKVLHEIRSKAASAFFTISTKLARAKLPDGRNAHVTLLTRGEWERWVADYFGRVRVVSTHRPDEVVLLAGPIAKMGIV